MAFIQSFTATQSSDSTLITITDTSNWSANGLSPSNFVRTFVVTDADDEIINTYVMPVDTNVLTYAIAVNQWQVITYNITGAFSSSLIQKYPFEQLYRLAYLAQIKMGCGCCDDSGVDMCSIDAFYQGAQYAIPIGDGISYNANINAAYTLLTGL